MAATLALSIIAGAIAQTTTPTPTSTASPAPTGAPGTPIIVPNSPYQAGVNAVVVQRGGAATNVAGKIKNDSGHTVLALWLLASGTWQYHVPFAPGVGTLTTIRDVSSVFAVLGPQAVSEQAARNVIEFVRGRDYDRLVAMVRYTLVVCIAPVQGAGCAGLPARGRIGHGDRGASGGVLPRRVRPEAERRGLIEQQIAGPNLTFYGVLTPSRHPLPPPGRNSAATDLAVVSRSQNVSNQYLGIHIDDGAIVALQMFGTCGPPLPPSTDPSWVQNYRGIRSSGAHLANLGDVIRT